MGHVGRLVHVRAAEPVEGFRLRLEFEDGTREEIYLEPYLHGHVFEPL